jgi:prevent-host-death family protein
MVRRVSVREARASFADLIGAVQHTGEPVVIERRGKPVVAMVPADAATGSHGDPARAELSVDLAGAVDGAPVLRSLLELTASFPRPTHTSTLSGSDMRQIAYRDRFGPKRRGQA